MELCESLYKRLSNNVVPPIFLKPVCNLIHCTTLQLTPPSLTLHHLHLSICLFSSPSPRCLQVSSIWIAQTRSWSSLNATGIVEAWTLDIGASSQGIGPGESLLASSPTLRARHQASFGHDLHHSSISKPPGVCLFRLQSDRVYTQVSMDCYTGFLNSLYF